MKKNSKIEITWENSINRYCNTFFYLPNSIAISKNGQIFIVDGGNNRICVFSSKLQPIRCIGSKGLGRYKFKEPVAVNISNENKIYISDWHNHRIVIYNSNLKYFGEFGNYGTNHHTSKIINQLKTILNFLKVTSFNGTYIPSHFETIKKSKKIKRKYDFCLLIDGLKYKKKIYGTLFSFFHYLINSENFFNKPNGVTFLDDKIVVSQKNDKLLAVYKNKSPYNLIQKFKSPNNIKLYNRLGNIHYDKFSDNLFVCDEQNHTIWILNKNFDYTNKLIGKDSGVGNFLPFSCCLLNKELICLCGGKNFQILNIETKSVIYVSENYGELHGVAYNFKKKKIYVVDRKNCEILIFRLSFK